MVIFLGLHFSCNSSSLISSNTSCVSGDEGGRARWFFNSALNIVFDIVFAVFVESSWQCVAQCSFHLVRVEQGGRYAHPSKLVSKDME